MKVEVAVLGSPSLIVLMVSVDVKATLKRRLSKKTVRSGQPSEAPLSRRRTTDSTKGGLGGQRNSAVDLNRT